MTNRVTFYFAIPRKHVRTAVADVQLAFATAFKGFTWQRVQGAWFNPTLRVMVTEPAYRVEVFTDADAVYCRDFARGLADALEQDEVYVWIEIGGKSNGLLIVTR